MACRLASSSMTTTPPQLWYLPLAPLLSLTRASSIADTVNATPHIVTLVSLRLFLDSSFPALDSWS